MLDYVRGGIGDDKVAWLWFAADLSGYFNVVTKAWDNIERLLERDTGNLLLKAALLEEVCLC